MAQNENPAQPARTMQAKGDICPNCPHIAEDHSGEDGQGGCGRCGCAGPDHGKPASADVACPNCPHPYRDHNTNGCNGPERCDCGYSDTELVEPTPASEPVSDYVKRKVAPLREAREAAGAGVAFRCDACRLGKHDDCEHGNVEDGAEVLCLCEHRGYPPQSPPADSAEAVGEGWRDRWTPERIAWRTETSEYVSAHYKLLQDPRSVSGIVDVVEAVLLNAATHPFTALASRPTDSAEAVDEKEPPELCACRHGEYWHTPIPCRFEQCGCTEFRPQYEQISGKQLRDEAENVIASILEILSQRDAAVEKLHTAQSLITDIEARLAALESEVK